MRQKQLAEAWANGSQSGTASNMFIENGIIYSYGMHFPIARWWKGCALMTNRGYSSSTARHIAYVKQAIKNASVIYMRNIPTNMGNLTSIHAENIKDWFTSVRTLAASLKSAKKPQPYIDAITETVSKMKNYIRFFDLSPEYVAQYGTIPEAYDNQKVTGMPPKTFKEIQEEYDKAEAAKYPELVENWKKGGSSRTFTDVTRRMLAKDPILHIRKRFGTVEVLGSGAEYEASSIFPKYPNFYEAVMRGGGCEGNTGFKMFGYEVTGVTAEKIQLGDKVLLASDIIKK